jgi:sulfane dehydrogenase subunit SoxC
MAGVSLEELQLATRNHGTPLEALRHPITPLGLHFLLTHYDIPVVDPETWRLRLDGCVEHPLSLTLAALQTRPALDEIVTMECAGNGRAHLEPRPFSQPWLQEAVGTARWSGIGLAGLLDEARPHEDAREVVFTGLDRGFEDGIDQRYQRSLPLAEAMRPEALLAFAMNGAPLPPQHGAPVRIVVPGWYGMASVKWLSTITVLSRPFTGYQQVSAYRLRTSPAEEGVALQRMLPRALMIPPGVPEFIPRTRIVSNEPCQLSGRAWSGQGRVAGVDISSDAGMSWQAATLDDELARFAWRGWSFTWHPPEPGTFVLCCRARDASGAVQPTEPIWNVGGYANNAVQTVAVVVRA